MQTYDAYPSGGLQSRRTSALGRQDGASTNPFGQINNWRAFTTSPLRLGLGASGCLQ
jgi:hypothetical protein